MQRREANKGYENPQILLCNFHRVALHVMLFQGQLMLARIQACVNWTLISYAKD